MDHPICQNCETKIEKPRDGKILRGNIYTAKSGQPDRLIEGNFPEEGYLFMISDIKGSIFCNSCFLKLVELDPFAEYFQGYK